MTSFPIDLLKQALASSAHGIEKECLRVLKSGQLSSSDHPQALGAPLVHPHLSLDFGESQLEMITGVFTSANAALSQLTLLHQYVYSQLEEESLWPISPPALLPDCKEIKLAHFGWTKTSYEKWLYRKGLSTRYGKPMQLLSGVHYNVSFNDSFWKKLQKRYPCKNSLQAFKDDQAFHIIRNFLREGWLISYLFGASPVVHQSFVSKSSTFLKQRGEDYYAPYGTSIRMSHLGYFSKIQAQNAVSFNSKEAYLKDLKKQTQMPHPAFEALGLFKDEQLIQMNTHLLQIEAEHYTRIRPKSSQGQKRPLEALKEGVDYLETRILDLNPYFPCGIDPDSLQFIELFLIYCLFKKSPFIQTKERKLICENQDQVALQGRHPQLLLHKKEGEPILMQDWALDILSDMKLMIHQLPEAEQSELQRILNLQEQKVKDSSLTPSARLLKDWEKEQSLISLGLKLAKNQHKAFASNPISSKQLNVFQACTQKSHHKMKELEKQYEYQLCGYEDLEFSTQMLIKEAIKRGICVSFLDRRQNFIKLEKNNQCTLVKQATITSLDSQVSYALMENKQATKKWLHAHELQVPLGYAFSSYEEGVAKYETIPKGQWVIKPNHTNMGNGIHFIHSEEFKSYANALKRVFELDSVAVVEPFVKGDEYRFLVVGQEVVAVAKRSPPTLIGDGTHTIKELIHIRNVRNQARQNFQKKVVIQGSILQVLKEQKLTLNSVLKKGQKATLLRNSNVSTGGESEDVTQTMPKFFKKEALRAAQSVKAHFCGVDMMIENTKENKYAIIELNFNPALFIHRYPSKGEPILVEKKVLDALGF